MGLVFLSLFLWYSNEICCIINFRLNSIRSMITFLILYPFSFPLPVLCLVSVNWCQAWHECEIPLLKSITITAGGKWWTLSTRLRAWVVSNLTAQRGFMEVIQQINGQLSTKFSFPFFTQRSQKTSWKLRDICNRSKIVEMKKFN